jgi:hypothetical protein
MAHNLAMFEGPHRNRNIMIIVAVVVIAAVIVLLSNRSVARNRRGHLRPSCRVGRLSWRPRHRMLKQVCQLTLISRGRCVHLQSLSFDHMKATNFQLP